MPEWDKIVEWCAIFITGLGVVFATGRNKQFQIENRKQIDELKKSVSPEDPENEIIRRADLDRQCKQMEKLLVVMEKNLIQTIRIELKAK